VADGREQRLFGAIQDFQACEHDLVGWSVVADSRWRVDDTPFRQRPEVASRRTNINEKSVMRLKIDYESANSALADDFWVYSAPNGACTVHRAACVHCRAGQGLEPDKREHSAKSWRPFEAYEAAHGYAIRTRTEQTWTNGDCGHCKPGAPRRPPTASYRA
jgi:hypothetical protein